MYEKYYEEASKVTIPEPELNETKSKPKKRTPKPIKNEYSIFNIRNFNDAFIQAYLKENRIKEAVEYAIAIKLNDEEIRPELTVLLAAQALRLKDWQMMSKILQTCLDVDYVVQIHKIRDLLYTELGGEVEDFDFGEEWEPEGIKVFEIGIPLINDYESDLGNEAPEDTQ